MLGRKWVRGVLGRLQGVGKRVGHAVKGARGFV